MNTLWEYVFFDDCVIFKVSVKGGDFLVIFCLIWALNNLNMCVFFKKINSAWKGGAENSHDPLKLWATNISSSASVYAASFTTVDAVDST